MVLEMAAPVDVTAWRRNLAILLPLIEEGCRRGLAPLTVTVWGETVRELVAAANPLVMSEAAFTDDCRRAGDVALFAALVWVARVRLLWIRAAGEDARDEAQRLRSALTPLCSSE